MCEAVCGAVIVHSLSPAISLYQCRLWKRPLVGSFVFLSFAFCGGCMGEETTGCQLTPTSMQLQDRNCTGGRRADPSESHLLRSQELGARLLRAVMGWRALGKGC